MKTKKENEIQKTNLKFKVEVSLKSKAIVTLSPEYADLQEAMKMAAHQVGFEDVVKAYVIQVIHLRQMGRWPLELRYTVYEIGKPF